MSSAQQWVDVEFESVRLGDKRLELRFRSILTDLARHCGKTPGSSFDSLANLKGRYRFIANARVSLQVMLTPHVLHTVERMRAHTTVLALQDATLSIVYKTISMPAPTNCTVAKDGESFSDAPCGQIPGPLEWQRLHRKINKPKSAPENVPSIRGHSSGSQDLEAISTETRIQTLESLAFGAAGTDYQISLTTIAIFVGKSKARTPGFNLMAG